MGGHCGWWVNPLFVSGNVLGVLAAESLRPFAVPKQKFHVWPTGFPAEIAPDGRSLQDILVWSLVGRTATLTSRRVFLSPDGAGHQSVARGLQVLRRFRRRFGGTKGAKVRP